MTTRPPKIDVASVIASLKRLATQKVRAGMARYAIPSHKAFGVSVSTLQKEAQRLGRNHALAAARWIGKDALRELIGPALARRLAARQSSAMRCST